MTTYYKFLNEDGTACNGGTGQWFLPKGRRPGKWMPKIANPRPCVRGYHLCAEDQLLGWLGPTLYIAEGRGNSISDTNKTVFEQARVLSVVANYNQRTLRLFAADCAEWVCKNH